MQTCSARSSTFLPSFLLPFSTSLRVAAHSIFSLLSPLACPPPSPAVTQVEEGGWEKNNRYPQIRSDCGRMPYSLLHTSDNSSRSVKPPLLCFILPSVFLAVNRYFLSLLFLPSSQLASASGSHSPPHPSVSSPALPPFFFLPLSSLSPSSKYAYLCIHLGTGHTVGARSCLRTPPSPTLWRQRHRETLPR